MSGLSAHQSFELSDVIAHIQGLDAEKLVNNATAQAELLPLARKLTYILEGPVNRATDLAFKVSICCHFSIDPC